MDEEADPAREYDRLRAELADFVLDALSQRIAEGRELQLSQALVEAIDRRVDQAVAERMGRAEWPDPDTFADSVIAAAAGRAGGGGDREIGASRARRDNDRSGRREPSRKSGLGGGQWALIGLLALAIIAAAAYFFLRGSNTPAGSTTNTVVVNATTGGIEPTPDGAANAQQPPTGNLPEPPVGSAGGGQNIQDPAR
jgi:hypothetical protein